MASAVPIDKRRVFRRDVALEKELPKSLEAERSILGAVLLDAGQIPNKALRAATEYIQPAHFSVAENAAIFRAMLELDEDRQPIDLVTLSEALDREGQLENAGGVAYLSQLADGMPRVSNISHHAKIVLDHAKVREIAHGADRIRSLALEGGMQWDKLVEELVGLRRNVTTGMGAKLSAVDFYDFLLMDLPPKEFVIEPLLTTRGFCMFSAQPGVGKSLMLQYLSLCIATGVNKFFYWNIPKARPVVYVLGEMPDDEIQDRGVLFNKMLAGRRAEPGMFKLITKDQQKQIRPTIRNEEGRRAIETHLQKGSVLVLDNLASLYPDGDDETKNWEILQDWLIDLTWNEISTIMVHHAGNDADKQRGTTKRLDLLDSWVKMRRPSDYRQEDDMRAEITIGKKRFEAKDKALLTPFELSLVHGEWTSRPLWELLMKRAEEMLVGGMSRGEVAIELSMSRYQVIRITERLIREGKLDASVIKRRSNGGDDPTGGSNRWDN